MYWALPKHWKKPVEIGLPSYYEDGLSNHCYRF